MKRHILFFASLFSVGFLFLTSCNKIKDAVKINIELSSANITYTIPQILVAGPVSISDANVYFNVDSIIKANNSKLSSGNIKSVTVKSCTVTLLNGDAVDNFSALESMKVDFSSNSNATVFPLAELPFNPDVAAQEITIPINSSINLKDYFNATTFTYHITAVARKTTSKALDCKATVKFNLEAGL